MSCLFLALKPNQGSCVVCHGNYYAICSSLYIGGRYRVCSFSCWVKRKMLLTCIPWIHVLQYLYSTFLLLLRITIKHNIKAETRKLSVVRNVPKVQQSEESRVRLEFFKELTRYDLFYKKALVSLSLKFSLELVSLKQRGKNLVTSTVFSLICQICMPHVWHVLHAYSLQTQSDWLKVKCQ